MDTYRYVEHEDILIVFQETKDGEGGEIVTRVFLTTKTGLKAACITEYITNVATAYVPITQNGKIHKHVVNIRRDSIKEGCDSSNCGHDITTGCGIYNAWKHLESYGKIASIEYIINTSNLINDVIDIWITNKLFHSLALHEAYTMIKEIDDVYEVEIIQRIKIKKISSE